MTTNQPLSLFISSKMAELAEERRAVQSALSCAGYLAYLFSKRHCRRNEQHEPHAGSFPVRRQIHLQICGEMLSSQAHVSIQSAMLKRVSHLPGFSALTFDAGEEEECFSELVHLQPEGLGAFETGFPTAQGRGKKLVTEEPKPVGSGRFRDHAQDASRVLGMICSSSLALREEGCVACRHGGKEPIQRLLRLHLSERYSAPVHTLFEWGSLRRPDREHSHSVPQHPLPKSHALSRLPCTPLFSLVSRSSQSLLSNRWTK